MSFTSAALLFCMSSTHHFRTARTWKCTFPSRNSCTRYDFESHFVARPLQSWLYAESLQHLHERYFAADFSPCSAGVSGPRVSCLPAVLLLRQTHRLPPPQTLAVSIVRIRSRTLLTPSSHLQITPTTSRTHMHFARDMSVRAGSFGMAKYASLC